MDQTNKVGGAVGAVLGIVKEGLRIKALYQRFKSIGTSVQDVIEDSYKPGGLYQIVYLIDLLYPHTNTGNTKSVQRARLKRFYKVYNPNKLSKDNIEKVLDKYKENYTSLFENLVKKYGEEPNKYQLWEGDEEILGYSYNELVKYMSERDVGRGYTTYEQMIITENIRRRLKIDLKFVHTARELKLELENLRKICNYIAKNISGEEIRTALTVDSQFEPGEKRKLEKDNNEAMHSPKKSFFSKFKHPKISKDQFLRTGKVALTIGSLTAKLDNALKQFNLAAQQFHIEFIFNKSLQSPLNNNVILDLLKITNSIINKCSLNENTTKVDNVPIVCIQKQIQEYIDKESTSTFNIYKEIQILTKTGLIEPNVFTIDIGNEFIDYESISISESLSGGNISEQEAYILYKKYKKKYLLLKNQESK